MPEPRRDHAQACRELEDRLGHPEMPGRWASGLWPVDREHALVIAQHHALLASIDAQDRHLPAVEFARYVTMLRAHYRSEEALQREIGFPELPEHAKVHAGFLDEVVKILEELRRDGPKPSLATWMAEGSPLWLGVHIHNDLAIARFCGERAIRVDSDEWLWRAGVPDVSEPPSLARARFPGPAR
ncbi:MAG TPA: hemerythrin family protein [Anaeromyxobacter sp.]|nr:hemerythrin family protein [Anaeromyxobacter sp.]